jgi:HSP20 family protein
MTNSIQNIRRNERRDPIRALQREMEQVFNQFLDPMQMNMNTMTPNMMSPAMDIRESDDAYLVSIDVPGMSQEDIKIEVDNHQLRVFGERKEERTEGDKTARSERYFGWFERVVTLPSQVHDEKIEAVMKNGVLHIAVPKVAAAQPKKISISQEKSGGVLSRLLGNRKSDQQDRPVKTA